MSALYDCQAIVAGSFALQPFLRKDRRFLVNNIDIVMSVQNFQIFDTKLLDKYRQLSPDTRLQAYNSLACEHTIFGLGNSNLASTDFGRPHSYNPVICNRIIFGQENTNLTVRLLGVKHGSSPLESIFYEPTTAAMNVITPNALFSAYPVLLHHHVTLCNPWDAFEINRKRNDLGQDQANQISLETRGKYVKRGFLDAEDLLYIKSNEEWRAYNHQCRVNSLCPLTPRMVGDRGCMIWRLMNCRSISAGGDIDCVLPGVDFSVHPQLDSVYWTNGASACGGSQDARPSAFVSHQSMIVC